MRIICTIIIATFLCASAFFTLPGIGIGAAQEGGAKQKNWALVSEPVFGGKVWLYRSDNKKESTVMLVHGIGDLASKIWEQVIPELEKNHRVIAFDLPGFGNSTKGDGVYSPENYAKFLRYVANIYGGDSLTVVGHSLGGALALYYAGTFPDELDRLVIVDAAGILHRAAFVKGQFLISGKSKENIFTQQPVSILNKLIESVINDIDGNMMPGDLSVFVEEKIFRKGVLKGNAQKIAGVSLISTDFSAPVFGVKAPTAVIWGVKDDIAPVRTGKAVAFLVPESFLHLMPGCGHSPMLDEPAKFLKVLEKCVSMKREQFAGMDTAVPKGAKNIDVINTDNARLEGSYGTVYIDGCKDAVLEKVRAERIIIKNSWVVMENVVVRSSGVALDVEGGAVEMNGCMLFGDTALRAYNSTFDCAGVVFEGKSYAVDATAKSKILFSVSKIKSPYRDEFRHGIYDLAAGDRL